MPVHREVGCDENDSVALADLLESLREFLGVARNVVNRDEDRRIQAREDRSIDEVILPCIVPGNPMQNFPFGDRHTLVDTDGFR